MRAPVSRNAACRNGEGGLGRIIEPVGGRLPGEDLLSGGVGLTEPRPARPRVGRHDRRPGRGREECADQLAILAAGDGARGIDEPAARGEHAPRCGKQARLHGGQLIELGGRAAQADVGVPANHAERRTGCIEQDAIERHAIPPIIRSRGITGDDIRLQCAALKILPHARQPPGVDVDGDQAREIRLAFGDEGGLAAGCGANVEHPLPGREFQGKHHTLRADVLHRHHALGKAGQFLHVARCVQHHGPRHAPFCTGTEAGGLQSRHIVRRRRAPFIHAQP